MLKKRIGDMDPAAGAQAESGHSDRKSELARHRRELTRTVDDACIDQLAASTITSMGVSAVVACLTAFMLWMDGAGFLCIFWLLLNLSVTALRTWMSISFTRGRFPDRQKWLRHYMKLICVAGLIWGLLPVLFMIPGDQVRHIMLAITVIIVATAALATLVSVYMALLVFILTAMVPYAVIILFIDAGQFWPISVITLLLTLNYCNAAWKIHQSMRQAIMLRARNANLLSRLQLRTAELKTAQQTLLDAMESIPTGLAIWDKRGKPVLCNRPYQAMYDSFDDDLKPSPMAEKTETGTETGGAASPPPSRGKLHHQYLADGRILMASNHPTSDGGTVSVRTDVTALKQAERAKEEFVSTVSHELRTPLTSIRGGLGLAVSGVVGRMDDRVKQMLKIAYRNSNRLLSLVEDLLDIENIASGRMTFVFEETDLVALMRQAVLNNAVLGEEYGITYKIVAAPESAPVEADQRRVLQILDNLLSNATKYSPTGQEVELSLTQDGDGYTLSVRDYGPGIDPAHRDLIYERFMQANSSDSRQQGGIGLGLNIVKYIVDSHRGHIDFRNVPDGGTVFDVRFPLRQSAIPAAGVAADAAVAGTGA